MDMLKGKVKSLYMKLFVASFGSALVTNVFGMVDAIMVGQYHGPNGTAALSIISPIWSVMYGCGLMIGIGASVLFANLRGRQETEKSNEYFTTAIIFGGILSVIATILVTIFRETLFRFFGADDTLLGLAQEYFSCIKFALPCCYSSHIFASFLRNDGNPEQASIAVIIGGIFNAIGDYFFVFVCDMGIFGAGLATAIGLYISSGIMLTHFFRKRSTLKFIRPTKLPAKVREIAVTGLPSGVTDFAIGIICILFNRQIMKYLNADALAVYGVIAQVTAFAQSSAYGIGQAAQPIMSQNLGARQHSRIKECLKYGLITSAVFGVFWISLSLGAPNFLVHLFMTPTDAVLEIAPRIIRIYGTSYLLLPFNIFATYYFQAMLKPQVSVASSIGRGAVISGATIMILPLIAGGDGIWYTMLITEIAVAIYSGIHMVRSVKTLLPKNF